MNQTKLTQLIAQSIKDADKRYVFEDYTAQAKSVLAALRQAGLVVVPAAPNEAMMEAGKESLKFGAQRPAELVHRSFMAMIQAAVKQPP
jgi:hypothetical protein